jgi:hypothetical protein
MKSSPEPEPNRTGMVKYIFYLNTISQLTDRAHSSSFTRRGEGTISANFSFKGGITLIFFFYVILP